MLEWNKVTNEVIISGFPYSFTDTLQTDGILRRSFSDGTVFYIRDGSIVLKTKIVKTEYMSKVALPTDAEGKINPMSTFKPLKAGTLDIETVLKNGKHVPYLFSFFDGSKHYSFFDSPQGLFDTMLKAKYRGFTIYAHNLSKFDIVFLFKHICKLQGKGYKVNILKKEDKIISIKITKGNNISITLKDSLLLLPSSLDKLCNPSGAI